MWAPLTAPHVLTVLRLCSSVYFHSYSCYIQIRNSCEVNLHITVTMRVIHDYCSRQGTTILCVFFFTFLMKFCSSWLYSLRSYISTSTDTHFDHIFSLPGDFQFSVSSDDNSEFWLSPDETPLNARLLVYVGQVSNKLWYTSEYYLKHTEGHSI